MKINVVTVNDGGANYNCHFFSPCISQQPNSGLGRLIVEVSVSYTIRHTHRAGRTPLTE
jgi:hypothetical protein